MLTLLILRHGKAAPEGRGGDSDRPLTKQGKHAAELVGELLRSEGPMPDKIVSSSAKRARDTARRVAAAAAHFEGALEELDELYLAEPDAYIDAVREHSGTAECVLVVGHNPGLEALALLLTGDPVSLPTAGLVVCELPIPTFGELSLQVRGKMARFFVPPAKED